MDAPNEPAALQTALNNNSLSSFTLSRLVKNSSNIGISGAASSVNLLSIPMMLGQRVNENSASIHYLTTKGMLNWTSGLPELNQTDATDCIQQTGGILDKADCSTPMEFLCEDMYDHSSLVLIN